MKILNRFENYRAPPMLQKMRTRGRHFDHRSIRREISPKNSDPSILFKWLCKWADYRTIPTRCIGNIGCHRLPGDGQCVAIEHTRFGKLSKYYRQTSGIEEVLH